MSLSLFYRISHIIEDIVFLMDSGRLSKKIQTWLFDLKCFASLGLHKLRWDLFWCKSLLGPELEGSSYCQIHSFSSYFLCDNRGHRTLSTKAQIHRIRLY